MVLHADEGRPAVLVGRGLHARELRRPHAAGADVPHLARLHHVVQRLHRLLDGRQRVEPVDLQQVDVRRVQPLQRRLHLVEDGRARQPALVLVLGQHRHLLLGELAAPRALLHRVEALGHDHQLVPRQRVLLDGLADDALRLALRVDVGRVPRRQPAVVRRLEQRQRLLLADGPVHDRRVAEAHAAKHRHRDAQPALAQLAVLDLGFLGHLCRRLRRRRE